VEESELGRCRTDVALEHLDQAHVRVRDEDVGIRAVEDDDTHLRVLRERATETIHLLDERQIEEIDRWVIDRDGGDAVGATDARARVVFVRHGDALSHSDDHESIGAAPAAHGRPD
jgi:hypothetical protein